MQVINAIFVNRKDVLDETKEQHDIYTEIMQPSEINSLENEFGDDSYLIIPYQVENENITNFFIILRDKNVNCEAFFTGIYGLFNLINDLEPGMIEFIKNNSINIDLERLTSVESYMTAEMVNNLFSIIFKGRRI